MQTPTSFTVPFVIEKTATGERSMDIYTRLLQDRIIFLGWQVSDQSANALIAQLLFLQMSDPTKPIHFYINSPGGSVTAGMAIYDTMQMLIKSGTPVYTYCTGLAASMGALLLSGGAAGHRYSLPNSRIMIHQPLGGTQGQETEMGISYEQIKEWRKILTQVLCHHSGQPYKKVFHDTERDNWMNAAKAKDYGLVDNVIDCTVPARVLPVTSAASV